MTTEDEQGAFQFFAGLLCGLTIGAGFALMLAPDSGRKTRKRLHRAADDLKENASDRWEEIADQVRDRVEEALQGAKGRMSR
jgi:gas vesicle protein